MIWSSRDEARPADAIVVLGAAQYAGRPSPVLKARLDHALDLWRRRLGKILILTGGTGAGDTTSEAAVGRTYAIKRDVPDTVILTETQGRTTSESMRAVAGMLQDRGVQTALLLRGPVHLLRIRVFALRGGGVTPTSRPHHKTLYPPHTHHRQ